jgi:uncharacterized protein (TIRG00374 family)
LVTIATIAVFFLWGIVTSGSADIVARLDRRFLIAIALSQPAYLLGLALMGIRLAELARRPRVHFHLGIKAFALFAGLNLFLPGRLAEVVKATYLRDHASVPLSQGFAGVLIGLFLDLTVFAVIAVLCITFVLERSLPENAKSAVIVIAAALVTAILAAPLLLRTRLASSRTALVEAMPYFGTALARIISHAKEQVAGGRMAMLVAISVAGWACSFATILSVLTLLDHSDLGVTGALAVLFAMSAGALIPALPAGLGVSEAGIVVVLMALGRDFNSGLVTAIAVRLAFALSPLMLASLIVLRERTGLRRLVGELYQVTRRAKTPTPPE